MNILFFGGCSDKKLLSKLKPILYSKYVEKLYLVRAQKANYENEKLIQIYPKGFFAKITPIREVVRILMALWILLTKKVDLIIGMHFIMHGFYAYIFAKLFNKKHIQNIIEDPKVLSKYKMYARIMNTASAIAVRGTNSAKTLRDIGVRKPDIFTQHNEYIFPESVNINNYNNKKYDLIYIGSFIPRKNLKLWVEIIEKLKIKLPNIKAVMIGSGSMYNEIENIIKEKDLQNNIDLRGQINNVEELNSIINNSRIHMMTTLSEGLPQVVVETMVYHVPTVISNVNDIIDIIDSGKNGFIINSYESNDYADTVYRLLSDKNKYTQIQEEISLTIDKLKIEYSLETITSKWDKVLEGISHE